MAVGILAITRSAYGFRRRSLATSFMISALLDGKQHSLEVLNAVGAIKLSGEGLPKIVVLRS